MYGCDNGWNMKERVCVVVAKVGIQKRDRMYGCCKGWEPAGVD